MRVKPRKSLNQTTASILSATPRRIRPPSTRWPASRPRYVSISVPVMRTSAQQRVARLQHLVEGAIATARGGLNILRIETGGSEPVRAGAAVFEDRRRLRGVIPPAEEPAFVNRMQRVDKHHGASQRQSGGNATLAEAGHNIGLRSAGQAGLRQPRGQCGKKSSFMRELYSATNCQEKNRCWNTSVRTNPSPDERSALLLDRRAQIFAALALCMAAFGARAQTRVP